MVWPIVICGGNWTSAEASTESRRSKEVAMFVKGWRKIHFLAFTGLGQNILSQKISLYDWQTVIRAVALVKPSSCCLVTTLQLCILIE